MNEQTNSVIINFLDEKSKFHYLEYFYSKMFAEKFDDLYLDKLLCLYESRDHKQHLLDYEYDNEPCYDHNSEFLLYGLM